jgi:hypothetical protein
LFWSLTLPFFRSIDASQPDPENNSAALAGNGVAIVDTCDDEEILGIKKGMGPIQHQCNENCEKGFFCQGHFFAPAQESIEKNQAFYFSLPEGLPYIHNI